MLTQPIPNSQPAFDATNEQNFSFVSIGGNQVVANKIIIRNQNTNEIIYENQQTTFTFINTVPANALINGTYYNYSIITYDGAGEQSAESALMPFYCYTEPTIISTNIPLSGVIENSLYEFEFEYNQVEGELLNSYVVNLYDLNDNIISTSGTKYLTSDEVPYNFSYTFDGFNDLQLYKISVDGKTINDTIISTPHIDFTVRYTKPNMFSSIELINNCEEGYINFKSNITVLNGVSHPDPPIYIKDEEVDLREDNTYVYWDENIQIRGNFLLRAWCRDLNTNSEIIAMNNGNLEYIRLNWRTGYNYNLTEMKYYIELTVGNYYLYSNYIDKPIDTDYIFVWLKRIDNIYELKIENIGGDIG